MNPIEENLNMTRTSEDDTVQTPGGKTLLFTPPIGEDYWLLRVRVGTTGQALIAFPKFGTIGCGFAREEDDWNTNLPLACPVEIIYAHIKKNKGDDAVSDEECLAAIHQLQEHALRTGLITEEDVARLKDWYRQSPVWG